MLVFPPATYRGVTQNTKLADKVPEQPSCHPAEGKLECWSNQSLKWSWSRYWYTANVFSKISVVLWPFGHPSCSSICSTSGCQLVALERCLGKLVKHVIYLNLCFLPSVIHLWTFCP